MLRLTLQLTLVALALLTSSCAALVPPDTRASDEASIRAADEQWSAAAAKNDLDGTVAFYSDDAVLLAPNTPIAKDRQSIRESWASLLAPNAAVSWKATKVEVAKSGEMAYLYGTYQVSIKDPKGGTAMNDTGKILEVWAKQSDGKWKCSVDMFNSDLPAPAMPQEKK